MACSGALRVSMFDGVYSLKGKNMKRNLTVLVLLVTWSLLALPSLSSVAYASEFLNDGQSGSGPIQNDIVFEGDGASDDDGEGDPGDAGDGYGISDDPDEFDPPGGIGNGNSLIIDELRLILKSLIQLVF